MKTFTIKFCPRPHAFCDTAIIEDPNGLFVLRSEAEKEIEELKRQLDIQPKGKECPNVS